MPEALHRPQFPPQAREEPHPGGATAVQEGQESDKRAEAAAGPTATATTAAADAAAVVRDKLRQLAEPAAAASPTTGDLLCLLPFSTSAVYLHAAGRGVASGRDHRRHEGGERRRRRPRSDRPRRRRRRSHPDDDSGHNHDHGAPFGRSECEPRHGQPTGPAAGWTCCWRGRLSTPSGSNGTTGGRHHSRHWPAGSDRQERFGTHRRFPHKLATSDCQRLMCSFRSCFLMLQLRFLREELASPTNQTRWTIWNLLRRFPSTTYQLDMKIQVSEAGRGNLVASHLRFRNIFFIEFLGNSQS